MSIKDCSRVWDKDEQKYIEEEESTIKITSRGGVVVHHDRAGYCDRCDNSEIERCVGFEDITGKKVYQGDILHYCYNGQVHIKEVVWNYGFGVLNYPLVCEDREDSLKTDMSYFTASNVDHYSKYAVVGNIHEHAELLKFYFTVKEVLVLLKFYEPKKVTKDEKDIVSKAIRYGFVKYQLPEEDSKESDWKAFVTDEGKTYIESHYEE